MHYTMVTLNESGYPARNGLQSAFSVKDDGRGGGGDKGGYHEKTPENPLSFAMARSLPAIPGIVRVQA